MSSRLRTSVVIQWVMVASCVIGVALYAWTHTERMRELRHEKKILTEAFEQANLGLITADADTMLIETWSVGAASIWGYTEAEAVGLSIHHMMGEQSRGAHKSQVKDRMSQPSSYAHYIFCDQAQAANGRRFEVHLLVMFSPRTSKLIAVAWTDEDVEQKTLGS